MLTRDDITPVSDDADSDVGRGVPSVVREEFLREVLVAVIQLDKDFKADRHRVWEAVDKLSKDFKTDRGVSARRHAAVMNALAVLTDRVDANDMTDAAVRLAVERVLADATRANEEAVHLGAEVGVVGAEVVAARDKLDTLAERHAATDAKATDAKRLAAVRVGLIVVIAVAVWELFRVAYHVVR